MRGVLSHLSRRRAGRALRLWPVGIVLALTFVAAVAVAGAVFLLGWDLLGVRGLKPEQRLTSKTLFDLVKLSFGVVAGAGGLVALVVAYRRQRIDEDGALREATRLHTERFTTAVSQLGEESPSVRLGGVHALAGLADDAPTLALRQTCIAVLCAELRLPSITESDPPPEDTEARHTYRALREVRHTIVRLIGDHLRLDASHSHSWHGHDFDLTGVVFDGGDFSGAVFSGGTVSFKGAKFTENFDFRGAEFSGGTVRFNRAQFSSGTVLFGGAQFSGSEVSFGGAWFSGGTVNLLGARFSGSKVSFGGKFTGGRVLFGGDFSGGTVYFDLACFSGSEVSFHHPRFSGGTVSFGGTEFSSGTVYFDGARFSGGEVSFHRARFCGGKVSFFRAQFSGSEVDFHQAEFSGGAVGFRHAQFSGGNVGFHRAVFSGGTVDFNDAFGPAPTGLLPAPGQAPPAGLMLPRDWRPTGS